MGTFSQAPSNMPGSLFSAASTAVRSPLPTLEVILNSLPGVASASALLLLLADQFVASSFEALVSNHSPQDGL